MPRPNLTQRRKPRWTPYKELADIVHRKPKSHGGRNGEARRWHISLHPPPIALSDPPVRSDLPSSKPRYYPPISPAFFLLPREIRDDIYDRALDSFQIVFTYERAEVTASYECTDTQAQDIVQIHAFPSWTQTNNRVGHEVLEQFYRVARFSVVLNHRWMKPYHRREKGSTKAKFALPDVARAQHLTITDAIIECAFRYDPDSRILSNIFTQNLALRDLTVHVILDMELGDTLGEGSLHPGLRFLRLLPRSQLWRLRVDVDYGFGSYFGSYEKFDEKTESLRRRLRTDFERIADSSIPTVYGKMKNWNCWVAAVANTYPREYEGFYTCKRLYFEVTMAGYRPRVV